MDRWRQYLFENHPEAQLQAWARRLQMFRFCRAYGGHANDGDSLKVVFPYRGAEDLVRFCAELGVELVQYHEQPPQPQSGVPYPGDEYARFPSLVPGTQWFRQPGHCQIAGQPVFVWCDRDAIRISIGSDYIVTEEDVLSALRVEKALAQAPLQHRDPPADNEHCICPKYYPAYFG
ncbi:hypothetical protein [Chitiniphilus eburneus]|uniref:Uncharacterized protein n=1 Tax=Chitiniphilus eburneus TaxID=2571148 RepID=A0A4U0PK61_9NEIS|nr:hypothetical protein [Chitiniphilus eburneus]TJZ68367.1 hypothetical protein FAZ21_15670 [Chitiniphilus eburneus]